MGHGVAIREAGCADATGIARVHVESWRTTYGGLMPDAVLDGLAVEQRQETWKRLLCAESSNRCAFVAESANASYERARAGGYDAARRTHSGTGQRRRSRQAASPDWGSVNSRKISSSELMRGMIAEA